MGELSKLMENIARECEAAENALYAPRVTGRHDFINKHYANMEYSWLRLAELYGPEEACTILTDIHDMIIRK
ncbi:hypothetical protein KDA_68750 [Dictyobacter alpinus]|uniref:Uncharacterized protein n=1 Tax=Dictyobacter alpinus TaxID=2014873 RepID=A0A402BJ07_9CHLR|nr:hypothetical protein [Dictyobacter alpinus]GCE31391.1 hypothetical protein KDA_68750 [Dictyobacter alpinus]